MRRGWGTRWAGGVEGALPEHWGQYSNFFCACLYLFRVTSPDLTPPQILLLWWFFSSYTFCSSPGEEPMACLFKGSKQGQIFFLAYKQVLEMDRSHLEIALLRVGTQRWVTAPGAVPGDVFNIQGAETWIICLFSLLHWKKVWLNNAFVQSTHLVPVKNSGGRTEVSNKGFI